MGITGANHVDACIQGAVPRFYAFRFARSHGYWEPTRVGRLRSALPDRETAKEKELHGVASITSAISFLFAASVKRLRKDREQASMAGFHVVSTMKASRPNATHALATPPVPAKTSNTYCCCGLRGTAKHSSHAIALHRFGVYFCAFRVRLPPSNAKCL